MYAATIEIGAGGEVDDPRAAIGDDHRHGDPGDHRARPEAEQDEEDNLLHVLLSLGDAW